MATVDKRSHLFVDSALLPTASLEIRDTSNHDSIAVPFGVHGYVAALFTIDNDLNQSCNVTVYGRNSGDSTWQANAVATAVAAGNAGSIHVTTPWSELKVRVAATVTPASGEVSVRMSRSLH